MVDEQCRYLFKMASGITDCEKKFRFIQNHINSLEECMQDGEQKRKTIKAMVSWALKEFNALGRYRSDVRMLSLWKILGKYSGDMKMEGVLENVHRLGFFRQNSAFYLMLAEHWAEQGNRKNFDKSVKLCEENCGIGEFESEELFRPLRSKYFGSASDEDGNTMVLIKMIADQQPVRRELTMFRDPTTVNAAQNQPPSFTQPSRPTEEFSIFHDPTTVIPESQLQRACEREEPPIPQSSTNLENVAKEEFSVFCDPTYVIRQPHEDPNAAEEANQEQQEDDEELLDEMCAKAPTHSILFDNLDDITVSGCHGKFATDMFTSTPRRSINPNCTGFAREMMEMDELFKAAMEEDKEEAGGLFAAKAKEGGGSKLQRRLSLIGDQPIDRAKRSSIGSSVNEIARALPQLNIGSTIEEEAEEECGNDFKENNNSSFASPDRKKKRQQPVHAISPLVKDVQQGNAPHSRPQPTVDLDESTHLGITVATIKAGSLNPWSEEKRCQVLRVAPAMVEYHEFLSEKCPRIEPNKVIGLGGELFQIEKLIGQGGFARVYKANSQETGLKYAIKYEAPACPWEVYICSTLKRRMPPEMLCSVMQVRDAYVFANASAIVYNFYPNGTLLDLGNAYKKNNAEPGGLLCTFFAVQLARTLKYVHEARIIHADVKPDNMIIVAPSLNERDPLGHLLRTPILKLIDWGRSIDMDHFKGQEFVGRAGTEDFDCIEMTTGMPWTYQTDFYGFCASIYVLMKGEYLVTFRYSASEKIIPVKQLKRRMALYDLWVQLFDEFLNIPNCKQLPSWDTAIDRMEKRLKDAVEAEPVEWKKTLERFNTFMKQQ